MTLLKSSTEVIPDLVENVYRFNESENVSFCIGLRVTDNNSAEHYSDADFRLSRKTAERAVSLVTQYGSADVR